VAQQHPEDTRSGNGAPRDITRDVIYFCCGAFVGLIVAARTVLGFSVSGGLQILLIAAGSLGLGYASARWGDSVWLWLGKWLRWLV
jgi:hypothetical protein